MRAAGDRPHGRRLRGLIVILWRAGLRIHEALALAEADLDQRRGAVLVRRGKGGRRREVGMDTWGWAELQPWLETRAELPWERCCACSPARRAGASGPTPPPGPSCAGRPSRPGSGGASRRTNSPRPRRRAGPRRRATDRHPAPTRPQQPRHHHRLSPRHRQRRDHRDRPRPTRPDDPGEHIAATLIKAGSSAAARRAKRKPGS